MRMVVAMESDVLDRAVSACSDAYLAAGSTVIVTDAPFATIFTDHETAEVALDTPAAMEAAVAYIAELSQTWDVVVLTPTVLAGLGHRVLRGLFDNVTIQPWWIEGATIRFGQPETP